MQTLLPAIKKEKKKMYSGPLLSYTMELNIKIVGNVDLKAFHKNVTQMTLVSLVRRMTVKYKNYSLADILSRNSNNIQET